MQAFRDQVTQRFKGVQDRICAFRSDVGDTHQLFARVFACMHAERGIDHTVFFERFEFLQVEEIRKESADSGLEL